MHLKMHSLVGTSGTFGADLLCLEARKIEQLIKSFLTDDFLLDVDYVEKIIIRALESGVEDDIIFAV